MRRRVAALLVAAALVALTSAASAELLHGTVIGLGSARLTLRTDEGRTVRVDLTEVDRAVRAALTVGDKVTVSGDIAGGRLAAKYVEADSGDPTRGGHIADAPGPDDPAWERVRGVLTAVSGTTLTLRTDGGRTLSIDAARVDPKVRAGLNPGHRLTVAGMRGADRKYFTARYIVKDPAGEAASPRGDLGGSTPRK